MNIEIENNTVTKDGETIGTILDGTCYLTREIGPTVKAAINSENDVKLKFTLEPVPESKDSEAEQEPPPSGEDDTPLAESPHGPRPERDPRLGDKCPKLLAWKLRQKGGE